MPMGVKTVAVTAGYISECARREFFAMDAANVDLKGFTDDFYVKLLQRPSAAGADTWCGCATRPTCGSRLTTC